MPIYEYHCPHCGKDFERLVFGSTVVVCPECGTKDPVKKFSVFGMAGVSSKGGSSTGSSCGPCLSSSCSTCR